MENKFYHIEIIEKFLRGQMDAGEKSAFEAAIKQDEFLKDAVEGYQLSKAHPEDLELINESILLNNKKRKIIPALIYSGIAAAIGIFVVIAYTLTNNQNIDKNLPVLPQLTQRIGKIDRILNIPGVDTMLIGVEKENLFITEIRPLPETKHISESLAPLFVNKTIKITNNTDELDLNKYYRFNSNHPYMYVYGLKVVDYRFEKRTNNKNYEIPSNKKINDYNQDIEFVSGNSQYSYIAFLEESLLKYKQKNYSQAIEDFDVILGQYPGDLNAMFYKALCYYELNNNKTSLYNFNLAIKAPINTFYEESKWYSSLILKEEKQYAAAEKVLNEIVNENGYYGVQARKELDELYNEFLED